MYCLDASVLVNSFMKKEKHHKASKELRERMKKEGTSAILPEIVLPEVSSAIARGTDDPHLALEFVKNLRNIPNFIFIPIDSEISNLATKFAAERKLKGVDSVYVAISYIFNVKLITLDKEQKEKSKDLIDVLTPEEELNLGERR
ncbi:MAG: type II toxin-antitoxin system VapC family toxin [Candidatus Methanofastidiosia archaeon]